MKRTTDQLKQGTRTMRGLRLHRGSPGESNLMAGMVKVIILCWIVPYVTLSVVLFYFSETKTNQQIRDTVFTSMENAIEQCEININAVIDDSKEASYDGTIRESYIKFTLDEDVSAETEMYHEITNYLDRKYKYSTKISNTILLFNRATRQEYYTYSNVAGATYSNINYFKTNAMLPVRKIAAHLGTNTRLVYIKGRLYLVRNLVTSDYKPFAVLVMEVNENNVFKSLDQIVFRQNGLVYMDGVVIYKNEGISEQAEQKIRQYVKDQKLYDRVVRTQESVNGYDKKAGMAYYIMNVNGQKITYVVMLDKNSLYNDRNTLLYTYVLIGILLIPMLFAFSSYCYANITKPISELMDASSEIEEGNYGVKINPFKKNREFGRLVDTFNHMSASLEESFNRIYAEEIALRDANMQALQSQINPHFLNNTLEIINWKARMSGDQSVSGMVESLGVMMEATMNRRGESFITIAEELKYVDAYLYIIEQRFGNTFSFEKEIEEELLEIRIPRLIIQPLVENMVEHGADAMGNRRGKLKIYEDGTYLHIAVENEGNISKQNAEKIEKLFGDGKLDENLHNIGIRNVNLRLKMLYGEESGLRIVNDVENLTVSEITINMTKLAEVSPK